MPTQRGPLTKDVATQKAYDAVVVGAGPNGLSAAITLARAGCSVLLVEASDKVGGGASSAELTLPGFVHDVGSAIHPLGAASPFLSTLPLDNHGLEWIHSPAPLSHPFDDGTAAVLERSTEITACSLGPDAARYKALIQPFAENFTELARGVLAPLRPPRDPLGLIRFGVLALRPARLLARYLFRGQRARSLFAGNAAHAIQPLEWPMTSAPALVLGAAGHAVGWPLPRGGSQSIADALAGYFRSLGGEIITGVRVASVDELPPSRAVLLDVSTTALAVLADHKLPTAYKRKLQGYRHGPAAFKLDLALDGPIPWRAPECSGTATVHLGATLEEIASAEREVWKGGHPEKPFVLLAQQSLFDSTRAPEGKHTVWAYCHVPNGSTFDMTERIERQVERFAPGFRDRILARNVLSPGRLQELNPNNVGGDIAGGVQDLRQLFTRPMLRLVPYSTPAPGLYLCSSSTPPGGGVHGMCGYFAARAALRYSFHGRANSQR